MAEIQRATSFASIGLLAKMGLKFGTVIDAGSADGSYFVSLATAGLLQEAVPLNIDPNALYETSLLAIRDVLGGDYRITALGDATGEMMMTNAVHPYWSSLRPADDEYWQRVNGLSAEATPVTVKRLDDVVAETGMSGPFLLKMDIQGGEAAALRGAAKTLEQTDVVVIEADIADFRAIDGELDKAGFDLFDLTGLNYARDMSLGWFYPVYLNRRLAHLREAHWWDETSNAAVIKVQEDRRRNVQAWLADVLPRIRAQRKPG